MGKDGSRSSRSQMFFKIGVPKTFAIFTGKHLCSSLFLIETPTQVFSCEYCKVFKNRFFIEHLRWLLLISRLLNFKKVAFVIDAYV